MRSKLGSLVREYKLEKAFRHLSTKLTRTVLGLRTSSVLALMAAVICSNLTVVPVRAQDDVSPAFDPGLYGMESEVDYSDKQVALVRALNAVFDERAAEVRANWDAFDEAKAAIINSYLAVAPRPPQIGVRYSSNYYGATYQVPHGKYLGDGLVGLTEVTRDGGIPISRFITRGQPGLRHVGSGWNFEPGGMLKGSYVLLAAEPVASNVTQCKVAPRFQYVKPISGTGIEFQRKGIEQVCEFNVNSGPNSCVNSVPSSCNVFGEYWSTNGQVLLDYSSSTVPILRYPDGTTETVRQRAATAYVPFNEGVGDSHFAGSVFIHGLWFTDKVTARNGYITNYTYDASTGWLASITDPKGRITQYTRDTSGRVIAITAQGPGGGSLTWQMTWGSFTWDPAATFSDIQCLGGENNPVECTHSLSYSTLTNLKNPDGRNFAFTYGPWGNLDTVSSPDGAFTDFDYGTSGTRTFSPPRLGGVPTFSERLDQRRLTATTVYPQGLSGPRLTTSIDHERTDTLSTAQGIHCSAISWIKHTYPNGNIMREGLCNAAVAVTALVSRTFAQETWAGPTLLHGTYYGNMGGLGDSQTPIGNMYLDWEYAGSSVEKGPELDTRPTQIIHKRNDVIWSEKLEYELSNIPASPKCVGCTSFRTTGNVTDKRTVDSAGNTLTRSTTDYYHNANPAYLTRNLLRLPASTRIRRDGTSFTRTDYTYDEYAAFPLIASGASNLDKFIGSLRGNLTTTTSYKDAQSGIGPVASHQAYFNTGDPQRTIDANGNTTTMGYDFGLCTPTHRVLTNTVTGPMVNGRQFITTSVSDCYSGLTLRTTDANGQSVFTQYDHLGRVVESAAPGDTLTALPTVTVGGAMPPAGTVLYLRDPNIAANRLRGGTSVGNNGQGPTAWTEYLSLGSINQQRVVTHAKDGTADGRYVKTFTDGLGRTIQTRSEVDPGTSGGSEVVSTTEYDSVGRVSKTYVPIFSSAGNTYVSPPVGALATVTSYDALGRVTSITPPGRPATTSNYSGTGTEFRTTITDANGNVTESYTDVLGRVVRTSRQNATSNCVGGWCTTAMQHDAAGRLLRVTDPNGNVTSFVYDGLGRKKQLTDPDMGTWTYEYDDSGNLIMQRDAKGQIINMSYDALNRMKVKDLPPTSGSPGSEDSIYFYDGDQP